MLSIKELQSVVERAIKEQPFVKAPENLYLPIEYTMSLGGKRIRPVMCLAACQIFAGRFDEAMPAALGVELFHNFTLLHDDIMDQAAIRRNKPTVHVKWNANTAILSGDAMMIKALQYVAQTPAPYLARVLDVFNTTALEVCEGQQYDMEFENLDDVDQESYIGMIRLKTAVLLAGSMKFGAIIGGAKPEEADLLYSFAIDAGIAFQLQDDLLDVYGDEATFGKSIGGDIVSNKKTYPMIMARNLANQTQLDNLNHWLRVKDFLRAEKISGVTQIYNQLGIRDLVVRKIDFYFDRAMKSLDELNLTGSNRKMLNDFAASLVKRER